MSSKDEFPSIKFRWSKSAGVDLEGKGRHGVNALLFAFVIAVCVGVGFGVYIWLR